MPTPEDFRAERERRRADPLPYYRPAPKAFEIRDGINDGCNELHVHGANRVTKSEAMVKLCAALLLGLSFPWVPRLRPKWRNVPLQIVLVVPTITQAMGDVLLKLHRTLPEKHRGIVSVGGGIPVYDFPAGSLHVVSWVPGIEAARQKIAGSEAHILWINEEAPSDLFGESVARGATVDGVRVITATMGLELTQGRTGKLDTSFYRERAQQAPWCGMPWCQHTGENDPDRRHIWIEFNAENTPWLTDAERERYIRSIPEHERAVRLGRSWGRLPKGRLWPRFAEEDHKESLTRETLERLIPAGDLRRGRVKVILTVDCGERDAEAAILDVMWERRCVECNADRPGLVECACFESFNRGCEECRASGKPGWKPCEFCAGSGISPMRWTVGEYMSEPALNRRADNVAGIRGMLIACGFSAQGDSGIVAAPEMIDVFQGDNQSTGKSDSVKRTELEALGRALSPRMVHHEAVNKWVSKHRLHALGDGMFASGRWLVDPRCRRLRSILQNAAYQPDGSLPRHDGPQGDVHLRNCAEYATARICLPPGTSRAY